MVFRVVAARRSATAKRVLSLFVGSCLLAGCVEEPRPRSYLEFMEDPIAREGTLARCNQDRNATADDPECINARRAASTAAARAAAARAEQHEVSSDLKREALRERITAQQAAAARAEEAAQEAEEAAYDAQWSEGPGVGASTPESGASASVPVPGAQAGGSSFDQSASASTWDRPMPGQPGTTGQVATTGQPATTADQLSFIEVPQIESPLDKALAEVELPAIAKPRQSEPKLEELTIPRPFRYPEPE